MPLSRRSLSTFTVAVLNNQFEEGLQPLAARFLGRRAAHVSASTLPELFFFASTFGFAFKARPRQDACCVMNRVTTTTPASVLPQLLSVSLSSLRANNRKAVTLQVRLLIGALLSGLLDCVAEEERLSYLADVKKVLVKGLPECVRAGYLEDTLATLRRLLDHTVLLTPVLLGPLVTKPTLEAGLKRVATAGDSSKTFEELLDRLVTWASQQGLTNTAKFRERGSETLEAAGKLVRRKPAAAAGHGGATLAAELSTAPTATREERLQKRSRTLAAAGTAGATVPASAGATNEGGVAQPTLASALDAPPTRALTQRAAVSPEDMALLGGDPSLHPPPNPFLLLHASLCS